jgi:hypothetical protein
MEDGGAKGWAGMAKQDDDQDILAGPGAPGGVMSDTEAAHAAIADVPWVANSTRIENCLRGWGISTLKDLVGLSRAELLRTHNLGKKSADAIQITLARMGLRLAEETEDQKALEAQHRHKRRIEKRRLEAHRRKARMERRKRNDEKAGQAKPNPADTQSMR